MANDTTVLEQRLSAVTQRIADLHKDCLFLTLNDRPENAATIAAKEADIWTLEKERDLLEGSLAP